MTEFELFFFFAVVLLAYSYAGYPLLLLALSSLRPKENRPAPESFPYSVSIILSAYNEEDTIKQKIDNFLQLDYPSDKLELVIVSDGSTDKTNEIVLSYKYKNIKVIVRPERRGKTPALNRAVREARGEILVFTDVDTMFPKDAMKNLIRHFARENVGLVTGTTRYMTKISADVPTNNAYWRYEDLLKRLESQVGDVVGASGSVYALRKDLYRELPPEIINDFVHPIEVVLQGYRAIFDPNIICYEEAAAGTGQEYSRQVRMVGQAFLIYRRYFFDLLRRGKILYAFLLTSHKFLRWLTLPLMVAVLVFNLVLWEEGWIYPTLGMLQVAFYSLVLLGPIFRGIGLDNRMFIIPFDFCFMNLAGAVGLYSSLSGGASVLWEKQRT
ncbi:MAG: glycosyltransferase family 2 protein [Candidatus Brocadiales bacterium]